MITFYLILRSLILIISILIIVAFYTIIERQLMGILQKRKGPTIIGFFGILQAIADGLKLFLKENIIPIASAKFLYIFAPLFGFLIALLQWGILPLSQNIEPIIQTKYSILYILTLGSLGIYSIILSGWASNSSYSFLGCIRATAQMISYEIILSLIFLIISIYANSFNLIYIINTQKYYWFIQSCFPIFIIFLITILAETNRHPFDLAEAESELVSGYNTEYSSANFAFFFLAEYANIIFMSYLTVFLFLGGWHSLFFWNLSYNNIVDESILTKYLIYHRELLFNQTSFFYFNNFYFQIFNFFFFNIYILYNLFFKILNPIIIIFNLFKINIFYFSFFDILYYKLIFLLKYKWFLLKFYYCYLKIFTFYIMLEEVIYNCLNYFLNYPTLVLSFKVLIISFYFIIIRSILPRYRYDQLMHLSWSLYIPISICFLIITLIIHYFFLIPNSENLYNNYYFYFKLIK